MEVTRRALFGFVFLPLVGVTKSKSEPVQIVLGRDNIVGIPFRRDVEEIVEEHPKEWYRNNPMPWNKHEFRSGPYIPLPDGRRIPVRFSLPAR